MRIYRFENYKEEGKHLHVSSSDRTKAESTHIHDFIEIVYYMSGKATEIIDGKSYQMKHGDMVFINPGSTHSFVPEDEAVFVNICFSPETVNDAMLTQENAYSLLSLIAFDEMRCESNFGKISFFGNERRDIEEILTAMISEYKCRKSGWISVMESYFNILITKMMRRCEIGMKTEDVDGMWQELSEYIDKNLSTELTLSALASKYFYNPSYFSRVFKEKFQMSFVEYVNRKRIAHAMELLSESALSVEDICQRVGFYDRSNFYHAFSKYTGNTPSEYRCLNGKVKKSDK